MIAWFVSALDLAFGSLYKDNIVLEQKQILATVAIATMFQLVKKMSIVYCGCMYNSTLITGDPMCQRTLGS